MPSFDQTQYQVGMTTDANGYPIPETSTQIDTVNVTVPIDVQNHLTQTITALNAVALTIAGGATPSSTSAGIVCDGFNEISVTAVSSVSHAGNFQIVWSYDNVNFNVYDQPSGDKISNVVTGTQRYGTLPVRAPYCKIYFANTDSTNAPTVTVNVYLKA